MNHSSKLAEDALGSIKRTKSGSISRSQGFDPDSREEQVIGLESLQDHRKTNKSIMMVGTGMDDQMDKDENRKSCAPVEIELSTIIRDVDVGQVKLEFDASIKVTPEEHEYPINDVDEPLSPSPRDSEPSDLQQRDPSVSHEAFNQKLIKIKQ
jgi:hypothetical protein